MAIISGRYGQVVFEGCQTYVRDWTIDYTAENYDATNFDESSGGRTYVAGIPSWSGSFSAYFSTDNTATPGTSGAAIFRTSSTAESGLYYGGIILMSMTVATPVDGVVTQNYTFQGLGSPATSTA